MRSMNIALVAHDHKKEDLQEWAEYNAGLLSRHHLFATATTGKLLSSVLDQPVTLLQSGPLGGDQQVGALIVDGAIDFLIFFWDPLQPQPHDPDVKALLRVAVVWNLPVACNRATADYLVSSPLVSSDYRATRPDYPLEQSEPLHKTETLQEPDLMGELDRREHPRVLHSTAAPESEETDTPAGGSHGASTSGTRRAA